MKQTRASARHIFKGRELFVDRTLIQRSSRLRHRAVSPQRKEIVFQFNQPWEGPHCAYLTVLQDPLSQQFRLYYRGHWSGFTDRPPREAGYAGQCLCVATSSDGVLWQRPELDLHPLPEAPTNNIILLDRFPHTHNFTPFVDQRPGVPDSERYKALAGGEPEAGLVAYTSADGLHWQLMQPDPVITGEGFDSMNVAFWSAQEQCYVAYVRTWTGPDGTGWRTISRSTSPDFRQWTPLREMAFGAGGRVHYYTNQTHPYPRAPHLYLGLAARFMEGRRVLTDQEADALEVSPDQQADCSDAVLLTSRGGYRYNRTFLEAVIRPQIGAEHWNSRSNYPALGLLQTGERELSVYLNQCYAQPRAHVQRYSYELDRLACLEAGHQPGELLTKPLVLGQGELQLNLATAAAGLARVELQTTAGEALPGYGLNDCLPMIGNQLAMPVRWRHGTKLPDQARQALRLRIQMQEACLYALQVSAGDESEIM